MRPTLVAFLAMALAGVVSADEPLVLRYTPDQGLKITYDLRVETSMQLKGGGATQAQNVTFTGVFVDTVKSNSGGRVVVTREFTKLSALIDGNVEDAPAAVMGQVQTFTYNERGELLSVSRSGPGATPSTVASPVDLIAAGLVRIPAPEGAVRIGDRWDVSSGLQIVDDALGVRAEATLVDTYESEGMQVALTDTTFSASGTIQGGSDAPSTSMKLEGALLQSTRIEDGALLGIRARMEGTSRFSLGDIGSIEVTIDDLKMEVSVAQ